MSETTNTQAAVATTDVKADETVKNEGKPVEKTLTQDEVDRIISERLAKQEAKAQKALEEAVTNAKTEAEKLAKMTQEEREKELIAKQAESMKTKERDLTLRENKIAASESLTALGISTKLVDLVVNESSEVMLERIETLKLAYDEAVQEGIKKGLAGTTQKDVNAVQEQQDSETIGKRHF